MRWMKWVYMWNKMKSDLLNHLAVFLSLSVYLLSCLSIQTYVHSVLNIKGESRVKRKSLVIH